MQDKSDLHRDKLTYLLQKTHSASIMAAPNAYEPQDKRKGQKVIDLDCRGLEFTEFKPDVSNAPTQLCQ